MVEPYNYIFKIILVGNSTVGKSSLLLRFTDDRFDSGHDMTIGVEFGTRVVQVEREAKDTIKVKLQVWDTAGQESFRSITRSYYRGCGGCMLVYDVTNRDSFRALKQWLEDIKDYSGYSENRESKRRFPILLVGNKTDLPSFCHAIGPEEGALFAQENGLLFIQTSAKEDINVEEAFTLLAQEIIQRLETNELEVDGNGITDLRVRAREYGQSIRGLLPEDDETGCCWD